MDSILQSIKKLIGLSKEDKTFDDDLIIHINSAIMVLTQLGIGPAEGFMITDEFDEWTDFIGSDTRYEMVKSYVYLKVRLLFDPPTSSIMMDAIKSNLSEFEWRLANN